MLPDHTPILTHFYTDLWTPATDPSMFRCMQINIPILLLVLTTDLATVNLIQNVISFFDPSHLALCWHWKLLVYVRQVCFSVFAYLCGQLVLCTTTDLKLSIRQRCLSKVPQSALNTIIVNTEKKFPSPIYDWERSFCYPSFRVGWAIHFKCIGGKFSLVLSVFLTTW